MPFPELFNFAWLSSFRVAGEPFQSAVAAGVLGCRYCVGVYGVYPGGVYMGGCTWEGVRAGAVAGLRTGRCRRGLRKE